MEHKGRAIGDSPWSQAFETWGITGQDIERVLEAWCASFARVYSDGPTFPERDAGLPAIPAKGRGAKALPVLWEQLREGSTRLSSPYMSGHMDTAPHPVAALTQGLAAAINNNLLFRELSPIGSRIEEDVIGFFVDRLGLDENWYGTFASGGSIANLTALFAALGGFRSDADRRNAVLLVPEAAHLSLRKAGSVLGIADDRLLPIPCDDGGRADVDALARLLRGLSPAARPTVVGSVGTTVHGSVDAIGAMADLCKVHGAWLHVDAIYGSALMFSDRHRDLLNGLNKADSLTLGPQKWMYVPRLSSVVLVKGAQRFDDALGTTLPYSRDGACHRGTWGLQGSRPTDAVVVWTLLQILGWRRIGEFVDRGIDNAMHFREALARTGRFEATHDPDLNIQVFRYNSSSRDTSTAFHERLTKANRSWVSLSNWRGEAVLRSIFLSPALTSCHMDTLVRDLIDVAEGEEAQ